MKILMSNSRFDNLLAPQYFKGLSKLGTDVHGSFYQDELKKKINTRWKERLYNLFPIIVDNEINQILLRDIETYQPQILWIFKGMEIWPETLSKIKSMGIKLVNYNLDHPFRYISKGSGNKNVLHSIPLFDLHMSYSQLILDELEQEYPGTCTFCLPFGFHDYVKELEFHDPEILKVGFVGHGDRQRARTLAMLLESGISVDVYGPNWKVFFRQSIPGLGMYPSVYEYNYWSTLQKYRVQLNLFRSHNAGSHNMRSFEIPASGGIMLANYSAEQASFFKEDVEAFYFHQDQDLVDKIKYLLSLDPAKADQIRLAARNRSMTSGYTYGDRSQKVLEKFKQLVHG